MWTLQGKYWRHNIFWMETVETSACQISHLDILKRRPKKIWNIFRFPDDLMKSFSTTSPSLYQLFLSLLFHGYYSFLAYLSLWVFPYSHTSASSHSICNLPFFSVSVCPGFPNFGAFYLSRLQLSPLILSFSQMDLYCDEFLTWTL